MHLEARHEKGRNNRAAVAAGDAPGELGSVGIAGAGMCGGYRLPLPAAQRIEAQTERTERT